MSSARLAGSKLAWVTPLAAWRYLAQLTRAIECDDGTRLDHLGAR